MKSVQEAKKRAGVPASERKSRIVAVEEHFATETYFDEVANLRVPADEEPERAFMSNLAMDAMSARIRFSWLSTTRMRTATLLHGS
jgi:hypothetical protein